MTRVRSLNVVCAAVTVVVCGLFTAMPSVREAAKTSLCRDAREREFLRLTDTDFLALAERRPTDAAVWLTACRTIPRAGKLRPDSLDHVYARAVALAPTSAAPHWFYAVQLMHRIPFERDERYVVNPRHREDTPTELNRDEKAAAAKADLALRRAARLDPQNAAVDYLRAYLALAEHRDTAAVALLRSGLRKEGWDEYGRAAAIATLETLRPILPLSAASTYAANAAWHPWASMVEKDLARTLAGMSVMAARQHDDDLAIFLRESAHHLGRLMIRNAYQVMDAATGVIVWTSGSDWDPKQPLPTVARDPAGTTTEIYPGAAVAAYLRQHGRASLAAEYESLGKQVRAIGAELDRVKHLRRDQEARARNLVTILGQLLLAGIPTVGLVLLIGMMALLLRAYHRPVQPIGWSLSRCLPMVSACLALVFVAGLIWPGESPVLKASREMAEQMGLNASDVRPSLGDRPWGRYFAVIGLPAILVSAWVAVLVDRRRSSELKAGPVGHYLGTLLRLLLPLAAVLSLAVFAFGIPAAAEAGSQTEVGRAVIYQGEIAYYRVRLPNLIGVGARSGGGEVQSATGKWGVANRDSQPL